MVFSMQLPHPITVVFLLVVIGGAAAWVGHNRKTPSASTQMMSSPPTPRVFRVSSDTGEVIPVVTGESFLGDNVAVIANKSGRGHRLEGVVVHQRQSDNAFILCMPAPREGKEHWTAEKSVDAITWSSDEMPLENSATWHDSDAVRSLPRRHPYCRAAACCTVVDSEGNVLLTRRRKGMRTFPRAWVCAGGGVDPGESLAACAKRELFEETGIVAARGSSNIRELCLWESFYPTSPADCVNKGSISAHHIVMFFVACLESVDRPSVTLQPEETDAFVWVPASKIRAFNETAVTPFLGDSSILTGWELHSDGSYKEMPVPLREVVTRYDSSAGEKAVGTAEAHLFALREFCCRS